MVGAQSTEWTTNNISVTCSQTTDKPANANVVFVIRYNDGKTLTSPKIAITASLSYPATPAGYCGTYAQVANIPSGQAGAACSTGINLTTPIQGNGSQEVLQTNYIYENGVCYETEYTGTLMCIDDDPTPTNEALSLEGTLSCVSTPVPAFNCGVSEVPEWKTSQVVEIKSDNDPIVNPLTIEIPIPNNSDIAYEVAGNYITVRTESTKECNGLQNECTTRLDVVSGNEIDAWMLDVLSDGNASCTFRNTNNTQNIQEDIWYRNTGGILNCNATNINALVKFRFRLKDGTEVVANSITLN